MSEGRSERARRLALTGCLIAVVAAAGAAPAAASDRIYWSNGFSGHQGIAWANLDGSGAGDLRITGATVSDPEQIVLDPRGGRLYWANYHGGPSNGGVISVANLDGSQGHDVDTAGATLHGAAGLALDAATGTIYWTNQLAEAGSSEPFVSYARLDGRGGGSIATVGARMGRPNALAIEPVAHRLYVSNLDGGDPAIGAGSIAQLQLDGVGGADLAAGDATMSAPTGVAVEPGDPGWVFWPSFATKTVSYRSLEEDTAAAPLFSLDFYPGAATVDQPTGVAYDSDSETLYWANASPANRISFTAVTGTGGADLKTIGATVDNPRYVAVLEVPRPAAVPPMLSGDSLQGARLSCTTGAWRGDDPPAQLYRAPHAFSYDWLRNGKKVARTRRPHYVASVAGNYRCLARATNAAGTGTQRSTRRGVQATATISSAKVHAKSHSAKLSFRGGPGTLELRCDLQKLTDGRRTPPPTFSKCRSPKTFHGLKSGRYRFEVRAISTAGAGPAAKKRFKL